MFDYVSRAFFHTLAGVFVAQRTGGFAALTAKLRGTLGRPVDEDYGADEFEGDDDFESDESFIAATAGMPAMR